ncbi:hypothetical protein I3843_08G171900 [Carya illinoinensis]|uniref:RING-type E3 ubiquitin transferase n=1 Tax=Carya illinoinensis TaxID=32201 RepID=A0A8T1PZW7_CARIL|nr:RING-H2 finger protein ATL8-like [Carya illinoinensis]XP_042991153.1 RING-H2 finger protein ATL8-like [Carya illinoinensis]KAG2695045.1 hypothetical protein I3760_08G172600 [Carya illinoinensis]KAG6646272.1 hypothetical protein CIPAW_08G182400 [Carya illinoinensis]KAG6701678.1 hypothetical protein I3842_08G177300 [Carya illinoinensis]KAG7968771.1 hypothetical protein I3843_08G171900 [Carya illinoinensis]
MVRSLTTLAPANSSTTAAAAPPPEVLTVESDFVVILAALLCALICVVGLIAVARCAWLRRSSTQTRSPARAQALANKGLKKKVLQSLPKFTYDSDGAKNPKLSVADCAICLGEFMDGNELRVLPQCGHAFHVSCIDTWLVSHSSCPSCRQILVVGRCHKCGQFPAPQIDQAGTDFNAITPNTSINHNTLAPTFLP